ncbi:Beta-glucoside kinase [subsurface metagenome]
MKQSNRFFCGIDFGGTAAKIGIVDEKGNLTATERAEISPGDGYDDIFGKVGKKIRSLCGKFGVSLTGIGIGSPGFIDRSEGRVLQGSENLPAFKNRSLVKNLSDDFALPVFADNDANCAAAGELKFGVGTGYESFVMITLGAGVGGVHWSWREKYFEVPGGLPERSGTSAWIRKAPSVPAGAGDVLNSTPRPRRSSGVTWKNAERERQDLPSRPVQSPSLQNWCFNGPARKTVARSKWSERRLSILPGYLVIWLMYSTRRPALSAGVSRQPERNCWSL